MWNLRKPSEDFLRDFLDDQRARPFSYAEVGQTAGNSPVGYDNDHYRFQLGIGKGVYDAARQSISSWKMFPRAWTEIVLATTPIEVGAVVAVLARVFSVWWLNACRIVYVVDDKAPIRRFGFAYGTLPAHLEQGEERFTVEWLADDSVWYDIRVFSRPRYWLARLNYPLARRMQRRFVRASQQAMLQEIAHVR